MRLAHLNLSSNAVFAPIAGFSDVGMRQIVAQMGAGLTYTEMVSAKGLCYGEKSRVLLNYTNEEKIKAVQLFGNDPYFMRKAIEQDCIQPFDLIDINMGCPVPKIVKNGEGSALLNTPKIASAVVKECCLTGKPISIKMRIGFADNDPVAVDFAKLMQDSGAVAIAVHGRTRTQMYSGKCDWHAIAKIVEAVDIPVFANGDVKTVEDYHEILKITGAQGVMIARGALGNPQLFAQITGTTNNASQGELMLQHIDTMLKFHTDHYVTQEFKKQFAYYCHGLVGGKQAKLQAYACTNSQQLKKAIYDNFEVNI